MKKLVEMRLTLLIALCFAVQGCDDSSENYLKGSLTDSYDMSFDKTRVRLYPSELSIEYVKSSEKSEKVAFRATLDVSGGPLADGTVYDLKNRGVVNRDHTLGSPLPDLESGELKLAEYSSEDGSAVEGTFKAIFVTSDKSKQTLRGGFAADLEVVEY